MNYRCLYDKLVDPKKLKPHPKNRNSHPQDQIDRLAKIIEYQGWRYPIKVSNQSGFVTAGHGRIEVAKALKCKVPVNYQDYESDEQEYADVQSDNAIASWSELDFSGINADIANLGPDFDIDLLGIKNFEIDVCDKDPGCDEDEVPEVKEPISKPGDLYVLGGRHRLLCGDATNIQHVELLMDGQRADMVFTDPPYRLETDGGCIGMVGSALKKQGKDIEFISDFNPENFLNILPTVFNKNIINAYIFCNKDLLPDYLNWAKNNKISFNVLIWKKPTAIPIGDSHRPDIEYLLLFRRSAIWNNGLNGVNYSRCLEFGREKGLHPTMKPIELLENEILISSKTGSNVLDLFGGSGSTLIALEKTNRNCFMMELDAHYIDVIVSRFCKYTKTNKVIRNGEEIEWGVE